MSAMPPPAPPAPAQAAPAPSTAAQLRQPTGDDIVDGYYAMFDQGRLMIQAGMQSNDEFLIKEGQDMSDAALKGLAAARKLTAGGGGDGSAWARLAWDQQKWASEFALQESQATGMYNGQPTYAAQQADQARLDRIEQEKQAIRTDFMRSQQALAPYAIPPGMTEMPSFEPGGPPVAVSDFAVPMPSLQQYEQAVRSGSMPPGMFGG